MRNTFIVFIIINYNLLVKCTCDINENLIILFTKKRSFKSISRENQVIVTFYSIRNVTLRDWVS